MLRQADYAKSLSTTSTDLYSAEQRNVLNTLATFKEKEMPYDVSRNYIRDWQSSAAKLKKDAALKNPYFPILQQNSKIELMTLNTSKVFPF